MGFASAYLSDRALFNPFIEEAPARETEIIITIPAFAERGITETIESLAACSDPGCGIEVLIHLNAPEGASKEELELNRKAAEDIESWKRDNNPRFRLFCFNPGAKGIKGWGAGLARKVVMDEALHRFNTAGNSRGVIVSLDADCTVSHNYLETIYNEFLLQPQRRACSIYFEHPLDSAGIGEEQLRAIALYELHLRCYYQGMMLSAYPDVYHTVGSAFAVRAGTYSALGGMNRRQAGEDFYFIQKAIPAGGYFYLTGATVYPSPRASLRVPFGTGPAVSSILAGEKFLTYHPEAFTSMLSLNSLVPSLYSMSDGVTEEILQMVDRPLAQFLEGAGWTERVGEIRNNTASPGAFTKRFYRWFNMFMVVRFLNHSHTAGHYNRIDPVAAALKILEMKGTGDPGADPVALLRHFRSMER